MREYSPPTTCHMSHVACHVSYVTCQVSHVTCHMFLFILLFCLFCYKLVEGLVLSWFKTSKSRCRNQKSLMLFFENVFWFPIYSWCTFYTFHNANLICVVFHAEKTFMYLVWTCVVSISRTNKKSGNINFLLL